MQVRVVWNQLFHPLISLVYVLGIARKCGPPKRADTSTKEWPNVGWYKAWKCKGAITAPIKCHLPNIVTVIKSWNPHVVESNHGVDVVNHRGNRRLLHSRRVGFLTFGPLLLGPRRR